MILKRNRIREKGAIALALAIEAGAALVFTPRVQGGETISGAHT